MNCGRDTEPLGILAISSPYIHFWRQRRRPSDNRLIFEFQRSSVDSMYIINKYKIARTTLQSHIHTKPAFRELLFCSEVHQSYYVIEPQVVKLKEPQPLRSYQEHGNLKINDCAGGAREQREKEGEAKPKSYGARRRRRR